MTSDIRAIVAEVDAMTPADPDDLDLDRLQALIDAYFAHPAAADDLGVWFRFFERYPDWDDHGMTWSILHGIETQPNSNAHVVSSVRRRPAMFPVLMVNRLLNGGVTAVGDVDLLTLLRDVAADDSAEPRAREWARNFLDHQRGRAGSPRGGDPA